jgi:HD-like signal output (HDOD) protein
MAMETYKALISERLELPSLPAVTMRLNQLLQSKLPAMGEVAELVGDDPALAGRVLQLVNSPLYPFRGRIDSLPRAVTLIGVRELRNLALAASVTKLFDGSSASQAAFEQFWRHSLCVALFSRGLAEVARQREPDRFFAMGLLHDIGALLLLDQLPEQAAEAAEHSVKMRVPLVVSERQILGYSHADLGGELMRQWCLPEATVAAVEYHHDLQEQAGHRVEHGIVHLANLLVHQIPDGSRNVGMQEGPGISAWERIGISHHVQGALVETVLARMNATHLALFGESASDALQPA